jgi:hypothetical protein
MEGRKLWKFALVVWGGLWGGVVTRGIEENCLS